MKLNGTIIVADSTDKTITIRCEQPISGIQLTSRVELIVSSQDNSSKIVKVNFNNESNNAKLREIYPILSSCILAATTALKLNSPASKDYLRKISQLEEQVSDLTDPNTLEGVSAREAAIRAAMMVNDEDRVLALMNKFMTEPNSSSFANLARIQLQHIYEEFKTSKQLN